MEKKKGNNRDKEREGEERRRRGGLIENIARISNERSGRED